MTESNTEPESLKDRHGALTRELILESAVDELEAGSTEGLTMRAIARRSNMAERTLFRHFATRDDLLDALAQRVIARFNQPPLPHDAAELPQAAQGLYGAFEAHVALTRAALATELFDRIRQSAARERWNAVKALLDRFAPGRSEHERTIAAANIRLVLSATSWHYYRFYFGFSAADSVEAARQVIGRTLDHLARPGP